MMSGVNPGESTDRWSARAAAEYHAAWDGLGVQRRRIMITGITAGDHPVGPGPPTPRTASAPTLATG